VSPLELVARRSEITFAVKILKDPLMFRAFVKRTSFLPSSIHCPPQWRADAMMVGIIRLQLTVVEFD